MKKIAIVYGGKSLEHDISIITALLVMEELDRNNIDYIPIYVSRENVFFTGKALLNKDNYENKNHFIKGEFKFHRGFYQFKYGHKYIPIDVAILCVHGAGTEDGTLKALFNFMQIPSSSSSILSSSLMQDKNIAKEILRTANIPVVDGFHIRKDDKFMMPNGYDFPLIIKPVHLGSSIGVKKVDNDDELRKHLKLAFTYDTEVIIEKVVENLKELNVAILGTSNNYKVSEIELVNTKEKVLSFKDKYELFQCKYETHIIPAKIPTNIKKTIEDNAKKAFALLNCQGVVRFDYLFDSKTKKIYLNEINAIPGSLAYYLFKNKKITMLDIINELIKNAHDEYNANHQLTTTYEYSSLKSIARKK